MLCFFEHCIDPWPFGRKLRFLLFLILSFFRLTLICIDMATLLEDSWFAFYASAPWRSSMWPSQLQPICPSYRLHHHSESHVYGSLISHCSSFGLRRLTLAMVLLTHLLRCQGESDASAFAQLATVPPSPASLSHTGDPDNTESPDLGFQFQAKMYSVFLQHVRHSAQIVDGRYSVMA